MKWYQTLSQLAILAIDVAMMTAALRDYLRPVVDVALVAGVEYRYR